MRFAKLNEFKIFQLTDDIERIKDGIVNNVFSQTNLLRHLVQIVFFVSLALLKYSRSEKKSTHNIVGNEFRIDEIELERNQLGIIFK